MPIYPRICAMAALGLLSAQASATTVCTQGELTRSISVVYSAPGQPVPCEVLYEKPTEGQSLTLWQAHNEAGYCETRATEFIDKLTSLGWDCRDEDDQTAGPKAE